MYERIGFKARGEFLEENEVNHYISWSHLKFRVCTVPELKRQSVLHRLIAHVSSGHIFISCQDTALRAPSNTKKLLFFLYLQVCGNLNRVSQIPSVCLGC